jgi:hypothetical protein
MGRSLSSVVRCGVIPVIATLLLALSAVAADPQSMPLGKGSNLVFAKVAEGSDVLGADDDFTRRMSPFDRQARLKAAGAVSDAEHRAFAARSVLEWSDRDRRAIAEAMRGLDVRFMELGVGFPKRVLLVKTSGDEEGGAAYTRGEAIMLPAKVLGSATPVLRRLLCHELFHVLSRSAPGLRSKLYASIGFEPCGDVILPGDFERRRITNPDAPAFDHCIRVRVDGVERWMVPVLWSRTADYDAKAGKAFFEMMEFRLLAVRLEGDPLRGVPEIDADGEPIMTKPEDANGFFEQVGRNTGYLIHPEEILADNFELLLVRDRRTPNPEIVRRLGEILRQGE